MVSSSFRGPLNVPPNLPKQSLIAVVTQLNLSRMERIDVRAPDPGFVCIGGRPACTTQIGNLQRKIDRWLAREQKDDTLFLNINLNVSRKTSHAWLHGNTAPIDCPHVRQPSA